MFSSMARTPLPGVAVEEYSGKAVIFIVSVLIICLYYF